MSVETVRFDAQRALVRVSGELDMATTAPLWAVLQGHLDSGRRFVRLDISAVDFLDASTLGGLTVAHHAALARRGTLVITGVRSSVARLLRLTGLDEVLFIGGPRADDDLPPPPPPVRISGVGADRPIGRPDRPVPWTPPAVARSIPTTRPDRPRASRPASG
jgi:anti-sigma B factor antagonist